jgi:hypothetical protein
VRLYYKKARAVNLSQGVSGLVVVPRGKLLGSARALPRRRFAKAACDGLGPLERCCFVRSRAEFERVPL